MAALEQLRASCHRVPQPLNEESPETTEKTPNFQVKLVVQTVFSFASLRVPQSITMHVCMYIECFFLNLLSRNSDHNLMFSYYQTQSTPGALQIHMGASYHNIPLGKSWKQCMFKSSES